MAQLIKIHSLAERISKVIVDYDPKWTASLKWYIDQEVRNYLEEKIEKLAHLPLVKKDVSDKGIFEKWGHTKESLKEVLDLHQEPVWCKHYKKSDFLKTDVGGFIFPDDQYAWKMPNATKFCPICGAKRPE